MIFGDVNGVLVGVIVGARDAQVQGISVSDASRLPGPRRLCHGSTAYSSMVRSVIPARIAGSPSPRCWSLKRNQFH